MAKVLVLYYSAYGHIETMANAVAEGARAASPERLPRHDPLPRPEALAGGAPRVGGGSEKGLKKARAGRFLDTGSELGCGG